MSAAASQRLRCLGSSLGSESATVLRSLLACSETKLGSADVRGYVEFEGWENDSIEIVLRGSPAGQATVVGVLFLVGIPSLAIKSD